MKLSKYYMYPEMSFLLSSHLYAKLNTLKKKYTFPETVILHGYVNPFFLFFDVYHHPTTTY